MQKLAIALALRLLFSVREVIGNAETIGRSRKILFVPEDVTVGGTTAQGGSKKECISMPRGNP